MSTEKISAQRLQKYYNEAKQLGLAEVSLWLNMHQKWVSQSFDFSEATEEEYMREYALTKTLMERKQ